MMTATTGRFTCENCGRAYVWRADLAGRKARCVCGEFIVTPATRPSLEDNLYAMAEEPEKKPAAAAPFKAGEGAVAGSQSLRPRSLDYQHPGTSGTTPVDRYFPDRIKDLYLPLGMILFGTIVEFCYALVFKATLLATPRLAIGWIARYMVIWTAALSATVLISATLRQIQLGKLPTAILKVCGVVMGTAGVVCIVGPVVSGLFGAIPIFGGLMSLAAYLVLPFICYYTLLGALFDLDAEDSRFFVMMLILAHVVMYLGMQWVG